MQLPITSRVKRSPLFNTDPKARRGGVDKGEDKVEIKNITTESSYEGKKMSDEAWKALTPERRRELNAGVGANKEGKIITESKEEVVTPGEDTPYEGTLMEEKTGRRLGPQEIRANSRSTKKIQRDIRRAKIKAARKNGTLTPELRKQYKAEEAAAELADFQAAAKNQSSAMASGKVRNESFVSGQRERLQGEDKPQEQTAEFKRKAKMANQQGITTGGRFSQASQAITEGGSLSDMAEKVDTADFSTGYTPFTGSGINMLSSVAKKSPYKMKGHPGKR